MENFTDKQCYERSTSDNHREVIATLPEKIREWYNTLVQQNPQVEDSIAGQIKGYLEYREELTNFSDTIFKKRESDFDGITLTVLGTVVHYLRTLLDSLQELNITQLADFPRARSKRMSILNQIHDLVWSKINKETSKDYLFFSRSERIPGYVRDITPGIRMNSERSNKASEIMQKTHWIKIICISHKNSELKLLLKQKFKKLNLSTVCIILKQSPELDIFRKRKKYSPATD